MPTPSPSPTEYQAIAERIRGLLAAQDQDLSAAAVRLGVEESSLWASIDPDAPCPRLEVLLAVIRVYAVDPMWLLSGEYDLSIHRRTMEEQSSITGGTLRQLALGRNTPTGIPIIDLIPDDKTNPA